MLKDSEESKSGGKIYPSSSINSSEIFLNTSPTPLKVQDELTYL